LLPWLKARARNEIESEVSRQAARLRLKPGSVSVRDQRTRWGSCSARGTLSFNWRLVMTPPEVLAYVVVHELAHLVHPNHSPDFWSYVGRAFPAYKTARTWLKKNAALLRPDDL
jgi:predicted metal-dependent hydrolase